MGPEVLERGIGMPSRRPGTYPGSAEKRRRDRCALRMGRESDLYGTLCQAAGANEAVATDVRSAADRAEKRPDPKVLKQGNPKGAPLVLMGQTERVARRTPMTVLLRHQRVDHAGRSSTNRSEACFDIAATPPGWQTSASTDAHSHTIIGGTAGAAKPSAFA